MDNSTSAAAAGPAAPARLQHRADYAPWPFELERVEMHFELAPRGTLLRSTLHLRRREGVPAGTALTLMGRQLSLQRLLLDGVELPPARYRVDADGLTIDELPAHFVLEVQTTLDPADNRSGKGLFELEGTLVTQMEPEGLQRLSYFPDRPDVLTRYRVTLAGERARYPVLLCNGNRVEARELPGGRHEVVWDDPFRKPSYTFGLVAGDLASITDRHRTPSGREVRLAVWAPAAYIGRCGFAMQALKRSMRWDETIYGLECDTDDYQLVALPGFPGAMENKGLNLFDISGVVADPEITTDDEALTIERIIAHEYFHNWTGNRVTCRDWFQLSLKEGLTRFRDQSYIDDLLGPGVYRIDTVRTLLRNQFPEDDGAARHPVRPESYADVEELYTATVYEKGAEIVRMLQTLLGPARFIEGVREYLRRFDGQAVTTDDFVATMAQAGARDLTQFGRWYVQARRARLTVARRHDPATRRLTLTLAQPAPAGAPGTPPLHVPVRLSLIGADGPVEIKRADSADPGLLELTEPSQDFVFEHVPPEAVPSLLEGFSAPVTVESHLSNDEQLRVLAGARDPYARWNAAQGVMIQAIRAGARGEAEATGLSEALVHTFERLLADPPSNPLLTAELLRVPDEPVLSEGLPQIDVDGHARARNALRATLGRRLKPQLLALVQAAPAAGDGALMHVAGMGRRRLAAVAQDLLIATGERDIAELCLQRVRQGATMTERFDALCCLVDHDGPQRALALHDFHARWKDHPTVVNKWFAAQALCRLPDAIDRIMALQAHRAFDPTSLTCMMAFFGSFFRQNRIAFHDASGRGYEWLADCLLSSDRMGRSGGAWLTPQISQWRRHAPTRQALMRGALERIEAAPDISNGLRGLAQRLLRA